MAGADRRGPEQDRGRPQGAANVAVGNYTGLHAARHFYASWCINAPEAGSRLVRQGGAGAPRTRRHPHDPRRLWPPFPERRRQRQAGGGGGRAARLIAATFKSYQTSATPLAVLSHSLTPVSAAVTPCASPPDLNWKRAASILMVDGRARPCRRYPRSAHGVVRRRARRRRGGVGAPEDGTGLNRGCR